MPWIISDANIIIDMDVGGILDYMFKLSETFAVPDILYIEELSEQHPELPGIGLQVLRLREEFIVEAYRLREYYPKPGMNDLFALALAKQEGGPLLTGDKDLREAADGEEVIVNGTLWLVQKLFDEDVLTIDVVERAYALMKREGRRLPWNEVTKQIMKMKC